MFPQVAKPMLFLKVVKPLCVPLVAEYTLFPQIPTPVSFSGGKQVLVVRGQQVGVTELVALIKEKLHAHLSRVHKEEGREHRHRIGSLPSTADRVKLPSYWTVNFHCWCLCLHIVSISFTLSVSSLTSFLLVQNFSVILFLYFLILNPVCYISHNAQ